MAKNRTRFSQQLFALAAVVLLVALPLLQSLHILGPFSAAVQLPSHAPVLTAAEPAPQPAAPKFPASGAAGNIPAAATMPLPAGTGDPLAVSAKAVSQPSSAWSMVGYDASGTNFNAVDDGIGPTNAPQLHQAWSYAAGWLISDAPAEVDGTVYFGSWDDNVYAVNAQNGMLDWTAATGASISSSPAVVGGTVYIGSQDGKLYALNAQSGAIQWTFATGGQITNSPVVSGGIVYITSLDGKLYAVNAATGQASWSYMIGANGYSPSTPTVSGDAVYVGSPQDNTLYALNTKDGKLRWSYATGGSVFAAPAVSGGDVFVSDWDGKLYALDAQNGKLVWAFAAGDSIGGSPAVANGIVYVGSWDHSLYAVSAQNGSREWAFETGDKIYNEPAVANGVVYVSSGDNKLYAVDARTGQALWSNTGSGPAGSPIVADQRVYVSDGSNSLLAFEAPPIPKQVALKAAGSAPWWHFKGGIIPGIGSYQVNTASDNLMVSAADMSIPNKGVGLTFARTYNSQSRHDYANTDGSVPDNYGNGWTNTYDAHLAFNTGNKFGRGVTVYDASGTPYAYMPDGSGNWIAPAGMHSRLTLASDCTYAWTDKAGESYSFYSPDVTQGACGVYMSSMPAYDGRLAAIYGRNHNTYLQLTYYWDGAGPIAAANLRHIDITTEAGQTAKLDFADYSGRRLLASLTYPDDSTSVTYGYDARGNLVTVDLPANTATSSRGTLQGIVRIGPGGTQCIDWHSALPCRETAYTYAEGVLAHLLTGASGPRWMESDGADGGFITFAYSGKQLTTVNHVGLVNPTGNTTDKMDGNPFQYGISTSPNFTYLTETFATAYIGGKAKNGGTTTWQDTDGHKTSYMFDGLGRLTAETIVGSSDLTTTQTWDAANNVTSSTDARGNRSDFAFDGNGNLIASAKPTTTTSAGTFRPTTYTAYDAHNNVVATCDAVWSNANGQNWTGAPAGQNQACASAVPGSSSDGAVTRSQYSFPAYEPYGELISGTSATGYVNTMSYDPSAQGGTDDGLPTATTGQVYTQNNGTAGATDTKTIYDNYGNIVCSDVTGDGINRWTVNEYDALNRLTLTANPDDTSIMACGKTPDTTTALPSATQIVTRYTYYPDSSLASETAPAEVSGSSQPVTYTYDADGNKASETHYYGCTATPCAANTTDNWYDAAGRLIEVELPADPSDKFQNAPWVTRYLYDLTQNGQDEIASGQGRQTLQAHGNMFSVQGYFDTQVAPFLNNLAGWRDETGHAYDALNRQTAQYTLQPSAESTGPWQTTSYAYDAQTLSPCPAAAQSSACSNDAGLLSSETSPLGVTAHYGYDSAGAAAWTSYTGEGVTPCSGKGTPCTADTYDPDGRLVSAWSSQFSGAQTYAYSPDGQMAQSTEPAAVQSAATLSYQYYPDGSQAGLGVASSGFTQDSLFQYSHHADGSPAAEVVNTFGRQYEFDYTYTLGGRSALRLEPGHNTTSWFEYMKYNSDGTPSELHIPGAAGSAGYFFQHDATGQITQTRAGDGGPQQWKIDQSYNSRNELTNTATTNTDNSGYGNTVSVTGTNYHGAFGIMQADPAEQSDRLDPLNGVLMNFTTNGNASQPFDWSRTANAGGQFTQVQSYEQSWEQGTQPDLSQSGANFTATNMNYTFNANNQLTGAALGEAQSIYTCPLDGGQSGIRRPLDTGGPSGPPCYGGSWSEGAPGTPPTPSPYHTYSFEWGPDGNLSSIGGGTLGGLETLHWAGNKLLFTTNPSGKIDDVKIDATADITLDNNGAPRLAVYDRLPSGSFGAVRTAEHPLASAPAMNVDPFAAPCGDPAAPCRVTEPSAGQLSFSIGAGQGVLLQDGRALDHASQTWLTPAGGGNPSNPISLKPYTYEYNNSMSYHDESTSDNSWGNFWWSAMILGTQVGVSLAESTILGALFAPGAAAGSGVFATSQGADYAGGAYEVGSGAGAASLGEAAVKANLDSVSLFGSDLYGSGVSAAPDIFSGLSGAGQVAVSTQGLTSGIGAAAGASFKLLGGELYQAYEAGSEMLPYMLQYVSGGTLTLAEAEGLTVVTGPVGMTVGAAAILTQALIQATTPIPKPDLSGAIYWPNTGGPAF